MNIFSRPKTYIILIAILFFGCNRDVRTFHDIHFQFQFDEAQIRLNNLGEPSIIDAGNAAQTPDMHLMSVHYIEISRDEFVPFKEGSVLYVATETIEGGDNAIDFDSSHVSAEGEDFIKINVERLTPGTYNYIRVSVAYQNYTVQYSINNIPGVGSITDQSGTIASFIGYRTYISDLTVNQLTTTINENKLQGFWAFETLFTDAFVPYNAIYTGQAPVGATTVVNPIDATSPVPSGSCVITGKFVEPLVISGDEDRELFITLSFSTNQSFEWADDNGNEIWEIDSATPENTEQVVDMGLRGLIPTWEWKD